MTDDTIKPGGNMSLIRKKKEIVFQIECILL